jgi:formamidopyrimidine-DNA glycosylase
MPEMPEIEAHAERLSERFAGRPLTAFIAFNFTALKTVTPAPEAAYGTALERVGRRGKYLILRFPEISFVVHLMQGGRLEPDEKLAAKPRGGQARFQFDDDALLLTEQGKERRAGVWCLTNSDVDTAAAPLDRLGPEAATIDADQLAELFAKPSMRIHTFLRDQAMVAGIGRRLANEVCHRAKVSPFATTKRLGADGAASIVTALRECIAEGLEAERSRTSMSSSKDRPAAVHNRTGEACPVCGDEIRAVTYAGYSVNYCPTCQTGGKVLADNTTSKFLK